MGTVTTFTLNGAPVSVKADPSRMLAFVLRGDLGLTGTKVGCGAGQCGTCTVLLDGAPVNACLIPAIHADGADILTVEGLARGGRLVALQRAFVAGGAAQCGMCTPKPANIWIRTSRPSGLESASRTSAWARLVRSPALKGGVAIG